MKTLIFLSLFATSNVFAQNFVVSFKATKDLPVIENATEVLLTGTDQSFSCRMQIRPVGFGRSIEKESEFSMYSFEVVKETASSFEELAMEAYARFGAHIPITITSMAELQDYIEKVYGAKISRIIKTESRFAFVSRKTGLAYPVVCDGHRHGQPDVIIALRNSGNFKYASEF